jgi:hypothetical protein
VPLSDSSASRPPRAGIDGVISQLHAIDARLLAFPPLVRRAILAATLLGMVYVALPNVPREYGELARLPGPDIAQRYDLYGPDSVSDMYGAKVTLNNPRDMYTRREVDQTPREAELWTKEETAPYPPVVLFTTAALYRAGEWIGIGYYGMIAGLACLFIGLSLVYFSRTRWYLFPILYLNFAYFGHRFFYVQDGTYLMMLVVIICALFLARARSGLAHQLMAVAITMKTSPLFYVKEIVAMKRPAAVCFLSIVVAGLVLPYFFLENYLYIYRFHSEVKGQHWYNVAGPLAVVVPFSIVVAYVEARLGFDMEDRIGWGLVPFAMLLAMKMNTARHLLIVLLVPDKRGIRNLAAAVGLGLHALMPGVVLLGSVVPIASGLLCVGLAYYLRRIGWETVRHDLRHPLETIRFMLQPRPFQP